MITAAKSEFFKELEDSLSTLDLSEVLTSAIENTGRGEADISELVEAVKLAHPDIPLLQDFRLSGDLFSDYLDKHYCIEGDYVAYYAYYPLPGGISKKSQ